MRADEGRVARYRAALSRDEAAGSLAAGLVDEFFDGSASQLVLSLLGSKRMKKADLARLRQLLDEEVS